jgi:hypothetical protein
MMRIWEVLGILSSSLVAGLFSGPWIALSRSFRTLHPKLFLGIVSHMDQNLAPAMTVLMPASMFSMIAIAIGSYGSSSIAFGLDAAALTLNFLWLVIVVCLEVPAVGEIASWTPSAIPDNWPERRDRWVAIHRVRVSAGLGSLILLVGAAICLEFQHGH